MLSTRELRRSASKRPKLPRAWRRLRALLLLVFAGALIYSGIHIGGYFVEGAQNVRLLQNVREVYAQTLEKETGIAGNAADNAALPNEAAQQAFLALTQINADAAGWLSVSGTDINHPFVQTDDNEYYLNHSFENDRSAHGCLFMDYRCSTDGRHLLIYGHRMKDGSMFGTLAQYEIEDYYAAHPIITLNLRGCLSKWQIFSAHRADDSLLPVQFADAGAFGAFIQSIKDLSLYDTGVDVSSDDTVLTLSTCDGSYERFLIHAKKID